MKKNLFILGVAMAALASCSSNEVMEIAEGRAIGFDSFVNNNTKAVTEVQALTNDFYVIGNYGPAVGNYTEGTVFNNELASSIYYWTADKHYLFGAYADGAGGQVANAAFDAAKGTLTFANYTPDDAKDLVVAISGDETRSTADLAGTIQKVDLNFKHMLSQLKFTFNTQTGDGYTIKISGMTVNAIKTGVTGVYTKKTAETIEWTNGAKADYNFTEIADVAVAANNNTASTDYVLVIPQASTDQLFVNFTASIEGPGIAGAQTKKFKAALPYAVQPTGASASIGEANTWTPGYRYNYVATINADNIAQLKPIEFTATVEAWKDANINPTTPQPAQ